jgi:3-oxoacyl-[acyl-carrier-protein] synthase II
MILEELEFARKRGAPILAEIAGYGMSGDAYHMTQPAPEHAGGFRVMRNAVRDAGVSPDVVNYVNAHGTSTPIGDTLEAHAIRNFFGDHKVAVSSTKSMTGHLLGGAGGLEAGITVLALRDQILPPTVNLKEPRSRHSRASDLCPARPQADLEYAMSNSFGFSGTRPLCSAAGEQGRIRNGQVLPPCSRFVRRGSDVELIELDKSESKILRLPGNFRTVRSAPAANTRFGAAFTS